jgi:hypothetical protein
VISVEVSSGVAFVGANNNRKKMLSHDFLGKKKRKKKVKSTNIL